MNVFKSFKNLSTLEKCLWSGSILIILTAFLLLGNKDYMTLTASLIGATALIFVAKGDVIGQVLTVVFSIFYAIISWQFHYYGEMLTYLGMTAPIAAASIITWVRNLYSEHEVKVKVLGANAWWILLGATAAVTAAFYFVLKAFDTPNLLFSTISIATSFLASSLMLFRSAYYALAYGLNDIVLIILWVLASVSNTVYIPMVICFIIFFLNDVYGFINWRRTRKYGMHTQTKN